MALTTLHPINRMTLHCRWCQVGRVQSGGHGVRRLAHYWNRTCGVVRHLCHRFTRNWWNGSNWDMVIWSAKVVAPDVLVKKFSSRPCLFRCCRLSSSSEELWRTRFHKCIFSRSKSFLKSWLTFFSVPVCGRVDTIPTFHVHYCHTFEVTLYRRTRSNQQIDTMFNRFVSPRYARTIATAIEDATSTRSMTSTRITGSSARLSTIRALSISQNNLGTSNLFHTPQQRSFSASHDDFAPQKKHNLENEDDSSILKMIESHVQSNRIMVGVVDFGIKDLFPSYHFVCKIVLL